MKPIVSTAQPVRVSKTNLEMLDKIASKTGLSRIKVLNLLLSDIDPDSIDLKILVNRSDV